MPAENPNNTIPFRILLEIRQFNHLEQSICIHKTNVEVELGDEGVIEFNNSTWRYSIQSIPDYNNGKQNNTGEDVISFPLSYRIQAIFTLVKGECHECNVSVSFVFDTWEKDNYLLMPGAAYNGNRFESRRIPYSPKLKDPEDIGPDKPMIISDVPRLNIHDGPSQLNDRSGAMSVPSVGFFAPAFQQAWWLFTPQKTRLGDFGYHISENDDKTSATIRIAAPVVREKYQYRITDNQVPSKDKAPDWKAGDSVNIPVNIFIDNCHGIQELFSSWFSLSNVMIKKPEPVCSFPFSSAFPVQEEKFNTQNWVEEHGYYSVGMREMFLQDWQMGWTGGMISTYPLLFSGNEETRKRVLRNFDFLFPKGISPSGLFWDSGESTKDGFNWYGGDIRKEHTRNWHLIRKSGDGIYYIVKQLELMRIMGIQPKQSWEDGLQTVVNAMVELWNRHGQAGHFVDAQTLDVLVGGSTSAGIVPAGMLLASQYFNQPVYREIAEELATLMYNSYVKNGISCGGVGDALQNPDSESAYGLLESFSLLYEHTGNKIWLQRAEEMADQFFTWVVGYNYEFPPNSTLGKLGIQTVGAVYANTQNKHAAPGICTYSGVALLRLYRATLNPVYLEYLRDIVRFIPQMFAFPERPVPGMKTAWMTERVSMTDWFEGIGELMTGSTWAETSLMLTSIEIPAVYILYDPRIAFCLDALEAEWVSEKNNIFRIRITNPSKREINARILTDSYQSLQKPLPENYLFHAPSARIKPGESREIEIKIPE